jgi:hypothetical protein
MKKNQLLKYPSLTLVKNKHHMNPLIRLTLGALVVAGLMASIASASTCYPAPHGQWGAYPGQTTTYGAAVQQPINTDGSSNFKANGNAVIPVKFALSKGPAPSSSSRSVHPISDHCPPSSPHYTKV